MKATTSPCVYFLFDGDELVYIGKTDNIFYRIGSHINEGLKKFDRFEMFETQNNDRLEALLITLLKPKYNKLVPKSPVIKSVGKSVDKSEPYTGDWFKNAWDEASAIFDSAFKEAGTI